MNWRLHRLSGRLAAGLILAIAGAAHAQDILTGPVPVRSHSGQFIIHAQREVAHPSAVMSNIATNRNLFRLDPALVSVSCERIKDDIYRQLGVSPAWKGHIYIEVRRTPFNDQNITITSQVFKQGWQYQLEFPDPVDRGQYVRAVTQVVLLELANRDSTSRQADVPLWLTEGMTQQLLTENEMEIILAPPHGSVNGLSVSLQHSLDDRRNPLDEARIKLGQRAPLSFDELSWPATDAATTGPADIYSVSAQMFVTELLRLIDGKASLRSMVTQLPQYYNWQFAFLHAFQTHFQRPLDVEKWWSLCIASSNGRNTSQMWTAEESWRRLDDAVLVDFQVREGTNAPARESWTLQGIIREWPMDRQAHALNDKVLELGTLRTHVSQNVVMLVDEYMQVLTGYIRNQHKSTPIASIGKAIGLSHAGQETINRLDILDERRRALHPAAMPVAGGEVPKLSAPPP